MGARRYILIGAGAVGGGIGGLLTRAGVPVVLVARGEHAARMAQTGLRLLTPDEELQFPVHVASAPSDVELSASDVLIFFTKTQHIRSALLDWADRPVIEDGETIGTAGELLPAITALNGLSAEDMALRYFARVYGATVFAPAAHLVPGEVALHSAPIGAILHIGRWPAGPRSSDDGALLEGLRAEWEPAGVLINITADPQAWKYHKLIVNLGNAVTALLEPGEDGSAITEAAREEGRAVLGASGIAWIPDKEARSWRARGLAKRTVPGLGTSTGSSSWQSLARGTGDIETDFLNGEIVRLAHLAGREAPVNAGLARLARRAARTGQGPGGHTTSRLSAELGLTGP